MCAALNKFVSRYMNFLLTRQGLGNTFIILLKLWDNNI